jgi:hypothetical protein
VVGHGVLLLESTVSEVLIVMPHSQEIVSAAGPATPLASGEVIGQRAATAIGIASLVALSLSLAALDLITGSDVS